MTANSTLNPSEKPTIDRIRHFQRDLYKFCKLYYPGLIKIAKYFRDRANNQNDNHVAIEGRTGFGKSMVSLIIIHLYCHLIGRVYNIERQTLFIPTDKELHNQMSSLGEKDVWWLDEAIKALDKHLWYKLEQIEMNQKVKTERFKLNFYLYNIQRFDEFNEAFRNHNIQARLIVLNRHSVVLRIVDEDVDVDDPWHCRENLAIKYKNKYGYTRYTVRQTQDERLIKEQKLPNYFMHEYVFDLTAYPQFAWYWEYYQRLKRDSRVKAKEQEEAEADMPKTINEKKVNVAYKHFLSKEKKNGTKAATLWKEDGDKMGISRTKFYADWAEA